MPSSSVRQSRFDKREAVRQRQKKATQRDAAKRVHASSVQQGHNAATHTAARVFQMQELADAIVDAAWPQDCQSLAQTCRTLRRAAHRPAIWLKQYAPASIDVAECTIYTAFRPRGSGAPCLSDAEWGDLSVCTKELGRYRHKVWYAKSDPLRLPHIDTQTAQVFSDALQCFVCTSWFTQPLPAVYPTASVIVQQRLHAMIRDRAYRCRHDISIPIYRADNLPMVKAACGVYASWTISGFLWMAIGRGQDAAHLCYQLVVFCIAVSLYFGLNLGVLVLFDDQAALNLISGPWQHQKLNALALSLPEHEE